MSLLTIALLWSCEQSKEKKELLATETNTMENTDNDKEPTDPEATELWEPVPVKVATGETGTPPSDAIVLFNGTDLSGWESVENGGDASWILNGDGSMTVKDQSGNIRTRESFGDVQLHVEWKNPETPRADGQNRGNSGIFLQGRYEVQVLDNYENTTYVNGQAGAIYKQHPPLVNASKPSGSWQAYDIVFHAPRWDEHGKKIKDGTITVFHNGVLIQDHVTLQGTTEYIGWPKNDPHGDAPLMLQDHKDNSGVSYRNIWLRKL